MSPDFIDIVMKLNNSLPDKVSNEGLCFSYHTSYFVDSIDFGGIILYCSESHSLPWDEEKQETKPLYPFIVEQFNKLITNMMLTKESI